MGGGVAMRAAGKVAGLGILNGGLRGVDNPVVSAARQVSRSVAAVVSSSDDVKLAVDNNNNGKVCSSVVRPFDDWEFAGVEDELFREAEEPMMPRLVFGGPPTIQEAKQATYDLNDALENTYLSPNSQLSFILLDSEHVETKPCLVSESSVTPIVSNHAVQAFRLLNESPKVQNVVASIASDPNVWNAVLQNPTLMDFLETHKTSVLSGVNDPDADFDDRSYVESPQESEPKSASGKGVMGFLEDIKQKITATVIEMVNNLSDTFRSFFGGSDKGEYAVNPDGTAGISVEKATTGATLLGLAIMVVMIVAFKRA